MISVFIITKDRPTQFLACLESLRQNFGRFRTHVLYKITNEATRPYYKTFAKDTIDVEEIGDFKPALISTLKSIVTDLCLFLTDDTIFYRPLNPSLVGPVISSFTNKDLFTFSLRLGENTTVQDIENPHIKLVVPPKLSEWNSSYHSWNWQLQSLNSNCGYPISMDGHFYRTKDIIALSEQIEFRNLREWEGNLIGHVRGNIDVPPLMSCLPLSYCVNVPFNFTQHPFTATVGPYGISLAQLNQKLIDGQKMDWQAMVQNIKICGSHQYLESKFKSI